MHQSTRARGLLAAGFMTLGCLAVRAADGNETEESDFALKLDPRPAGPRAGYQASTSKPV